MTKQSAVIATILLASITCWTQAETSNKNKKEVSAASQKAFRSSPAYAELLLRRTELSSTLESLILEYTEEFPKIIEIRHVLKLIDRETERIAKVKEAEASKLTLALGKLIIRKIELETELWSLQRSYKDEHPDVKRAKRKLEIYETAIGEILS